MSISKKDKNSTRNILITALLGAAAVGYVFLVFLPGQAKIAALREQLKEKQTYILKTNQLAFATDPLKKEVAAADDFTKQWAASAPEESKLSGLFGEFSNQARQAGVKVVRFDPRQTEKMQTIWRVTTAIGFDGDFRQCFDFLRRVESNQATIWTGDVKFEPDGKDSEKIHGEIVLTIFADNRDISD